MTDFSCKHAKVSGIEPSGDDSLVQPTDWNAEHSIPADYVEMFEGLLPVWKKVVLPFTGAVAEIPTGWQLCNGTNGTYDLRDKFIVGAKQDEAGTAKTAITGSLTQSGSATTHSHTGPSHTHSTPNHTHAAHAASTTGDGGVDHTHVVTGNTGSGDTPVDRAIGASNTAQGLYHTHSVSITSQGASAYTHSHSTPQLSHVSDGGGTTGSGGTGATSTVSHVPAYFALAFIQWVGS